jgi:Iron-containing redox enzyme
VAGAGIKPFVTNSTIRAERALPIAAGPLSAAVLEHLRCRPPRRYYLPLEAPIVDCDPYGLDLQLALYVCYELHYRGFADVDSHWEWDPGVLMLRARLEHEFMSAVRRDVGEFDTTAEAEMARLSTEPVDGSGPSYYLRDQGTWDQLREYFVHRSLYHLKEGDPHAWVIPRLTGTAKAAFVAIEFDEFGGGRADHVHQQLFAELMAAAGLDPSYLRYLDDVPAEALATVNLMSMFGLHRNLRGAAIGHFAATEITSPPGSRRLVEALTRLDAPEPCLRFYREHVEADAVHEQIVRTEVVGDLVSREPELGPDVVFGIRAFELVEDRLADQLMAAWSSGAESLRRRSF